VELRDLTIFARVAQEGSISRAAARLHMAQPSVSQRLLALEAEVGRPLFARHRRGVALTPAGQALLPYAERALGLIAEGVEAVRAPGDGPRVVIAAPPSIASHVLPPLLKRLVERGCDIALDSAHSHQAMQQLLDGAIHAGFLLRMPARSGIIQRPVLREQIICVAAPGHPLAGRRGLTLRDLAQHPVALYAFQHPGYLELREALQAAAPGPLRGMTKVSPVDTALQMAREAGLITFVPRLTAADDLEAGRLVELAVADLPDHAWEVVMVYRDRKVQDPAVEALLEAVRSWRG
jgi:DNA-binding transcriptional LysR family regulator